MKSAGSQKGVALGFMKQNRRTRMSYPSRLSVKGTLASRKTLHTIAIWIPSLLRHRFDPLLRDGSIKIRRRFVTIS